MTIPQYNNNEFSLYQLWHRLSGSRILFVVITFTKLHDLSTSGKSCKFNPVNLPEVHNKYSRWIRCSFFEEQEKLLVATSCRRVAVIWLHRQWCFHVSTPSGKAKHFDRLIVLFAKLKAKATKLTQKIHWLVTPPNMLSTCSYNILKDSQKWGGDIYLIFNYSRLNVPWWASQSSIQNGGAYFLETTV